MTRSTLTSALAPAENTNVDHAITANCADEDVSNPHLRNNSNATQSSDRPSWLVDSKHPGEVDALATVSSHENDQHLYGSSSTIAFVRHFTQGSHERNPSTATSGAQKTTDGQSLEKGSQAPLFPLEAIRERDMNAVVYPPRQNADDFLRCFWEFVHPVFPIVHKTSFIKSYEQVWLPRNIVSTREDNVDVEDIIFSSTLNLVFALGCQFSALVAPAKKASVADEFYRRARRLFIFDIVDSISLSAVQMLLLTGVYLQSTRHAHRCWNVVGFAIRIAQSLGLHYDHSRSGSESQLQTQMKRRVWHTCLILDR